MNSNILSCILHINVKQYNNSPLAFVSLQLNITSFNSQEIKRYSICCFVLVSRVWTWMQPSVYATGECIFSPSIECWERGSSLPWRERAAKDKLPVGSNMCAMEQRPRGTREKKLDCWATISRPRSVPAKCKINFVIMATMDKIE